MKNKEVHMHLNVHKTSSNYSAGLYDYPLTIPAETCPKAGITAPCLFYSTGGAAGSQRGVTGLVSIGTNGVLMIMPTDNSNTVNTVMLDIVFPID